MSETTCTSKTSFNTLLEGRIKLIQPRQGYRAAIDPVLLAAAIPAKSGQYAVELGLGAGAAALCLLARIPGLGGITGLELDPGQAELAHRNAILNGQEQRLPVVAGDAANPPSNVSRNFFDHALMNPPYLDETRHDAPANAAKALAHVETTDCLKSWTRSAGKLLKQRGTLSLIHRADRLDQILAALSPVFGSLRIFPLWPREGSEAKRVIVQAVKGGKAPCRLLPGLVLHEGNAYTFKAGAVLRDMAPLDLGQA